MNPYLKMAPVLALIAILAVVGFGGCGSGDGESTAADNEAAAPKVTKAAFIKKASAICTRRREKAVSAAATYPANANSSKAVALGVRKAIVPELQAAIDEVASIGVIEGSEAETTAFIDETTKALETAEQKKAIPLPQLETALDRSGQLARKLGIPACAYS